MLLQEIQQLAMDDNVFGDGFKKEDLQRRLHCSGINIDLNDLN
jgi:hypothetical protein